MEEKPIIFEDWEQALMTTVSPDLRRAYHEAIVKFRYWLQETGKVPDVETFKEHLEWKKSYLSPERFDLRREALRWYYKEGNATREPRRGTSRSAPRSCSVGDENDA